MASTTAILYIPVRVVGGLFSAGRGGAVSGTKSWLPAASVPVVGEGGRIAPEWYRFLTYLTEKVLGGASAATLPEVEGAVTKAEVSAIASYLIAQSNAQMNLNNAQALAAVVEVTKSNSLSGATQIPPVQLAPIESSGGDGGGAAD